MFKAMKAHYILKQELSNNESKKTSTANMNQNPVLNDMIKEYQKKRFDDPKLPRNAKQQFEELWQIFQKKKKWSTPDAIANFISDSRTTVMPDETKTRLKRAAQEPKKPKVLVEEVGPGAGPPKKVGKKQKVPKIDLDEPGMQKKEDPDAITKAMVMSYIEKVKPQIIAPKDNLEKQKNKKVKAVVKKKKEEDGVKFGKQLWELFKKKKAWSNLSAIERFCASPNVIDLSKSNKAELQKLAKQAAKKPIKKVEKIAVKKQKEGKEKKNGMNKQQVVVDQAEGAGEGRNTLGGEGEGENDSVYSLDTEDGEILSEDGDETKKTKKSTKKMKMKLDDNEEDKVTDDGNLQEGLMNSDPLYQMNQVVLEVSKQVFAGNVLKVNSGKLVGDRPKKQCFLNGLGFNIMVQKDNAKGQNSKIRIGPYPSDFSFEQFCLAAGTTLACRSGQCEEVNTVLAVRLKDRFPKATVKLCQIAEPLAHVVVCLKLKNQCYYADVWTKQAKCAKITVDVYNKFSTNFDSGELPNKKFSKQVEKYRKATLNLFKWEEKENTENYDTKTKDPRCLPADWIQKVMENPKLLSKAPKRLKNLKNGGIQNADVVPMIVSDVPQLKQWTVEKVIEGIEKSKLIAKKKKKQEPKVVRKGSNEDFFD